MRRLALYIIAAGLLGTATSSFASPFDGTWVLHRSHTTPRGLHNEGSDTLVIDTSGPSTEMLDQTVTMRSADGRSTTRPVRIVQTRYSLKTLLQGQTLTIRWSALKLVASRSDRIPQGLHVQVGPSTATYSIRRGKLAATFGTDTDIFTRAK